MVSGPENLGQKTGFDWTPGPYYGLSDKLALKLVVQFLTGTARKFFMKHIATCQSEWNMASLYEALFDYCFPTDYKATLRLRLEQSTQGRTKV